MSTILQGMIATMGESDAGNGSTIRIAAAVDTTLTLACSSGVLTAGPSGDYGATGGHDDTCDSWAGFGYGNIGLKWSDDFGQTWNAWDISNDGDTLDLSAYGSSITGINVVASRATVTLSGQTVTIDDQAGGSDITVVDIELDGGAATPSLGAITNITGGAYFTGQTSGITWLTADPYGCAFNTSDTLPDGITLSPSGMLYFDGTSYPSGDTATITVTVSAPGWTTATASLVIDIDADPVEEYCPSCGTEFDGNGDCPNDQCPLCPYYSPNVTEYCPSCGMEMSDNGEGGWVCTNAGCPECPDYQGGE